MSDDARDAIQYALESRRRYQVTILVDGVEVEGVDAYIEGTVDFSGDDRPVVVNFGPVEAEVTTECSPKFAKTLFKLLRPKAKGRPPARWRWARPWRNNRAARRAHLQPKMTREEAWAWCESKADPNTPSVLAASLHRSISERKEKVFRAVADMVAPRRFKPSDYKDTLFKREYLGEFVTDERPEPKLPSVCSPDRAEPPRVEWTPRDYFLFGRRDR